MRADSLSPALRGEHRGGSGADCMSFALKFGFVGGINEAGLGLNEHALDLAVFQEPSAELPTLCKRDFTAWALGLHSTVDEVAAGLHGVRVVGDKGGQWGLHDAQGASIVIEFVKGMLTVHNNSVGENNTGIGVMTNDPTWDWQLQNLNNFAALQPGWYGGPHNSQLIQRDVPREARYPWATKAYDDELPTVPSPIGHAYNLLGLPGDGSPPSRFVRAFYLRGFALLQAPPRDLNGTLVLMQELLNSVYKVLGSVAARNALDPLETTPLSSIQVKGPGTRQIFYRSRYDMTWRRIDLARLDFSPGAKKRSARVAMGSFGFVDATPELL